MATCDQTSPFVQFVTSMATVYSSILAELNPEDVDSLCATCTDLWRITDATYKEALAVKLSAHMAAVPRSLMRFAAVKAAAFMDIVDCSIREHTGKTELELKSLWANNRRGVMTPGEVEGLYTATYGHFLIGESHGFEDTDYDVLGERYSKDHKKKDCETLNELLRQSGMQDIHLEEVLPALHAVAAADDALHAGRQGKVPCGESCSRAIVLELLDVYDDALRVLSVGGSGDPEDTMPKRATTTNIVSSDSDSDGDFDPRMEEDGWMGVAGDSLERVRPCMDRGAIRKFTRDATKPTRVREPRGRRAPTWMRVPWRKIGTLNICDERFSHRVRYAQGFVRVDGACVPLMQQSEATLMYTGRMLAATTCGWKPPEAHTGADASDVVTSWDNMLRDTLALVYDGKKDAYLRALFPRAYPLFLRARRQSKASTIDARECADFETWLTPARARSDVERAGATVNAKKHFVAALLAHDLFRAVHPQQVQLGLMDASARSLRRRRSHGDPRCDIHMWSATHNGATATTRWHSTQAAKIYGCAGAPEHCQGVLCNPGTHLTRIASIFKIERLIHDDDAFTRHRDVAETPQAIIEETVRTGATRPLGFPETVRGCVPLTVMGRAVTTAMVRSSAEWAPGFLRVLAATFSGNDWAMRLLTAAEPTAVFALSPRLLIDSDIPTCAVIANPRAIRSFPHLRYDRSRDDNRPELPAMGLTAEAFACALRDDPVGLLSFVRRVYYAAPAWVDEGNEDEWPYPTMTLTHLRQACTAWRQREAAILPPVCDPKADTEYLAPFEKRASINRIGRAESSSDLVAPGEDCPHYVSKVEKGMRVTPEYWCNREHPGARSLMQQQECLRILANVGDVNSVFIDERVDDNSHLPSLFCKGVTDVLELVADFSRGCPGSDSAAGLSVASTTASVLDALFYDPPAHLDAAVRGLQRILHDAECDPIGPDAQPMAGLRFTHSAAVHALVQEAFAHPLIAKLLHFSLDTCEYIRFASQGIGIPAMLATQPRSYTRELQGLVQCYRVADVQRDECQREFPDTFNAATVGALTEPVRRWLAQCQLIEDFWSHVLIWRPLAVCFLVDMCYNSDLHLPMGLAERAVSRNGHALAWPLAFRDFLFDGSLVRSMQLPAPDFDKARARSRTACPLATRLILTAVRVTPLAVMYLNAAEKKTPVDVAHIALQGNGEALGYLTDQQRGNPALVALALRTTPAALRWVRIVSRPQHLVTADDAALAVIMTNALKRDGSLLRFAPASTRGLICAQETAVITAPDCVRWCPDQICSDIWRWKRVFCVALKSNPMVLQYLVRVTLGGSDAKVRPAVDSALLRATAARDRQRTLRACVYVQAKHTGTSSPPACMAAIDEFVRGCLVQH